MITHAVAAYCFLALSVVSLTAGVVTTSENEGFGSLREVVADANPGDTITFSITANEGSVILLSSAIEIAKNLTIEGSINSGRIEIDGGKMTRAFNVVGRETAVEINNLIIVNGLGQNTAGGGIFNEGLLKCTNVTISDCQSERGGGAIWNNQAELTLINCELLDNSGAPIAGGAIRNSGGTLVMSGCSVNGNSCSTVGGAISISRDAVATISDTRFGRNICESDGGAIWCAGQASVSLTNCSFVENSARQGSAILVGSSRESFARNCTFSKNRAQPRSSQRSAAIASGLLGSGTNGGGVLSLIHCTIANNDDGGIFHNGSDQMIEIINCISSGNIRANRIPLAQVTSSLFEGALGTGPLGDYGGSTFTIPLLPGSPAIDAATPTDLIIDQRNLFRAVGTASDIGAFEFQGEEEESALGFEEDADGDGAGTGLEIAIGSDPFAPDSPANPLLNITETGESLIIRFPDQTDAIESVFMSLTSSRQLGGFGSIVASNETSPFPASEGAVEIPVPVLDSGIRFYRLEASRR